MANYQQKHWIVYLLLGRLSVAWYSLILTYLGTNIGLINGNNKLTVFGWLCTSVLAILVFLFEIANKYKQSLNKDAPEISAYALLNNLREETDNICKAKLSTLLNVIHSIKKTNQIAFPTIISNPLNQLDEIAKRMASSLRFLLREDGMPPWQVDDLYVSIAYQFPLESDNWFWATEEHGMSLQDLLTPKTNNPDQVETVSTFKYLLSSKGNTKFYNSKADAEKDHKYLSDDLDERDSSGKLLGSIACYEDFVKKSDKTYIHYVLTIATYSRPFTRYMDEVDNVRHNMKMNFVSLFSIRIRIELCLLYLQQLKELAGQK